MTTPIILGTDFIRPPFRIEELLILFAELSLYIAAVAAVTSILNTAMKCRGFRVRKRANFALLIPISILLFFMGGGISLWTVKGIIFVWILLYASYQDSSTREADDFLWVMLLILALVDFQAADLISMLTGAIALFVPQIAVAILVKHGGIGGADIKFSTAAGFLLGFWNGIVGYMTGLLLAVIFTSLKNRIRRSEKDRSFALLPFLSVGLILGYLIG